MTENNLRPPGLKNKRLSVFKDSESNTGENELDSQPIVLSIPKSLDEFLALKNLVLSIIYSFVYCMSVICMT
jgi:hypothetical protein